MENTDRARLLAALNRFLSELDDVARAAEELERELDPAPSAPVVITEEGVAPLPLVTPSGGQEPDLHAEVAALTGIDWGAVRPCDMRYLIQKVCGWDHPSGVNTAQSEDVLIGLADLAKALQEDPRQAERLLPFLLRGVLYAYQGFEQELDPAPSAPVVMTEEAQ